MTKEALARVDEIVEGDRDFLERLRRVAVVYSGEAGDLSEIDAFVRFVHKASGETVPDDFSLEDAAAAEGGDAEEDADAPRGRRRSSDEPSYEPFA